MFTIDLLKGQGLPTRSRPRTMVASAIAATVPVVAAIAMFGFYLQNKIIISIRKGEVASYEKKIGELSDAVKLQESLQQKIGLYNTSLSEVKSAVSRHTQWSGILATVVENMPKSVVLTALEVKQHTVKRSVPKKDEPGKTTVISVPAPVLRMTISSLPHSASDKAVKKFRDSLRSSGVLGPRLENIVVSQKTDKLGGLKVVSYEIDCLLKPKL